MRISPEPFEYFDERTVHSLLTDQPAEYFQFIKDKLSEIATGHAQIELPPKQVFSDPGSDSDFRVMPCIIRSPRGVRKTVKLVGTNTMQQLVPDQVTVGKAFAIHPEENFISHIFEACLLSSARTGICAALAIDLLSRSRGRITLYGAGRVSYYAALYAAALGGVSEMYITDIDPERAKQAAELLALQVPTVRFTAVTDEELGDTDVIVLATTSTKPVCSPPGLNANLIISLGADTDFQSELDTTWVGVADIYVDSRDSARFGDLKIWLEKGLISPEDITDLFELVCNGAHGDSSEKRIFISTGSALFDNLTIGYLLSRSGS